MRFATFDSAGREQYGYLDGDTLVSLSDGPDAPPDLASYLALHHGRWQTSAPGPRHALDSVTLLPPIPDPSKVFCVATNFHEPARGDKPVPAYPLLFTRIPEAQVGHGNVILKPAVSEKYDFEGELAVIIGQPGHKIPREEALSHVAGYSCFNDGSVRDWQKHSTQFTPGKNFACSGGFGPYLVTPDEAPAPADLRLETRVNGVVKQAIALENMIFDVSWLIAYCSTFAPLRPGDVIVTGTPSGFGSTRTPPEFLAPGDLVEVEIPGIGLLANRVAQDGDPRGLFS